MKNEIIQSRIIQQVKDQISLPEVVRFYISLDRNLKALCPFHSEKTPSFFIHPNKKYWHCFGCGASGDVISFVQRINKLSFIDAVKLLANQVGIYLPRSSRFQFFINRKFDLVQQQLRRVVFLREVLKDYEIMRYTELREEWRGLLLKPDKDRWDYLQMDMIECFKFNELDDFIRKVQAMINDLEKEVQDGKHL